MMSGVPAWSRLDHELQQCSNQQDHPLSSSHEQISTEVEVNGSSNRTVRYSETLPLNAFVQQAKPSQTRRVLWGKHIFVSRV